MHALERMYWRIFQGRERKFVVALVPDLGREVVVGFWGADGGKSLFPVMVIGRDMMASS